MKQNTREILQRFIQRLYDEKQYRPVVVGVVYDSSTGRFLIGQSAYNHNVWSFVQGGIKPGEQLEDCLARELQEEAGISPTDIDTTKMEMVKFQLLDYESDRKRRRGFTKGKAYFGLIVPYQGDGALTINPEELAAAQWVTPEEAVTYFRQERPEKIALLEQLLAEAEKRRGR